MFLAADVENIWPARCSAPRSASQTGPWLIYSFYNPIYNKTVVSDIPG